MRFYKTMIAGALVAAAFTAPVLHAESGVFNFTGMITDSPCSISGVDLDKDINLGAVTVADLGKNAGKGTSIPRKFEIALTNCAVGSGPDSVTVTLTGKSDEYGSSNFGLNESGRGANLVIEKDGTPLVPGTETAPQTLVDGTNILAFNAFVQGVGTTDAPVPGDFTATTQVTLAYQ